MPTVVTRSPETAASFVRNGLVVAFPTETVYGLGADAFDADAVARIFAAKGRPADNPLIVHVASASEIDLVASEVPGTARRFVAAFMPGPLTLVLAKRAVVPDVVSAGLATVGVRVPSHPTARRFLAACGRPVAAPSANRSGRPSPTRAADVLADLDGRIACLLEGDATEVGLESTVVDCTGRDPVVLRAGAVTLEDLGRVVPSTSLASALAPGDVPRSPGAKHRHYAPRARVLVVASPPDEPPSRVSAFVGVETPRFPERWARSLVVDDLATYARELFAFFRACDAAGVTTICCQSVEPRGLGLAIMDRVTRAAER
jgi:L-threonylcarbamoyladenylate synthase